MTAGVDRADIQGNVLRAYGNEYDEAAYLFAHVAEADGGQAWLAGLVDSVTTDEDWQGDKPGAHLNVAVTCTGLVALGVPQPRALKFSEEFCDGMAARHRRLGDLGPSDPANWDGPLGSGDAHVLLMLTARTADDLEDAIGAARAGAETASGVSIVHEQRARLLRDDGEATPAREHFGFADGFAQPAIEDVSDDRARGGGVLLADGQWRSLALGEFILGYPDEDTRVDPQGRLPSMPAGPLGRSGTYMIYRKLRQDVALFRRTLRNAAALYHGGDEDRLAAKVVGRWRNGTPLVRSPEAPDPAFASNPKEYNAFRYLDMDADGRRCPLGAHIRRSNPRDGLGWPGLGGAGLLSFRHRIIRRGMPYGPPLPAGATEDDRTDRGLIFVCFNASISRQFESIQMQWLNDGNGFHLGHDSDFLLGDPLGTGKMTVQGDPPFFLSPQGPFVVTRGGEYLFLPGIAALRALAAGVGS